MFFVGSNGSGKTVLLRGFYNEIDRYCVFDPKGDFPERTGDKIIDSPFSWKWSLFPRWIPRVIYRPDPRFQARMDLRLKYLFYKARAIFKKRKPWKFRVAIDEGLFQSKTGKIWLQRSAITGRSFELGLDVNSQRPLGIPVEIRTEFWRMYVFYLADREDEKEILRYAKGTVTLDELQMLGVDHSFIELRRAEGGRIKATHYPPLRIVER